MSEQHFNIVFRGDLVFGFQLNEVKLRLQQLFNTDETKINALFTGKPVVIKRNLDAATAEKYRATLLQLGCQVEVAAQTELTPKSKVPPPPPSQPDRSAGVQNWSLAPVGAELLNRDEQRGFVPRNVDTSNLQVRPLGGNLLDTNELPTAVSGPVAVPRYELADAGADLLRAEEKPSKPLPNITVGQWGIAALGADLIEDDEKQIIPTALITVPDVGLAPVGSDLEQIKSQVKPLTPDISGIRLADRR